MLVRRLAVVAVLLAAAPAAYADFEGTMWIEDGGGGMMGTYAEGDPITITVWHNQTYWAGAGDDAGAESIQQIQINWTDSRRDDGGDLFNWLVNNSSWGWSNTVDDGGTSAAGDVNRLTGSPDDTIGANGVVNRTANFAGGSTGWIEKIAPVGDFQVGTLTFPAPAYDPGGVNDYTISLEGGDYVNLTDITLIYTSESGDAHYEYMGGGAAPDLPASDIYTDELTLSGYQFTVTPEPATLALLALGGATALIRRKR